MKFVYPKLYFLNLVFLRKTLNLKRDLSVMLLIKKLVLIEECIIYDHFRTTPTVYLVRTIKNLFYLEAVLN